MGAPGPMNATLSGGRVFVDTIINKGLEIVLDPEWALNTMTDVLMRERRRGFGTQRHRMEAKIGVIQLRAEEHQG